MDGAAHKSRVTVLGCGGSGGVPLIGNYWGVCDPNEPKNVRSRAALHVQIGEVSIAIDTGPDFRQQINRENIERIDCVLYTHAHSDHVNGIDDLRYMSIVSKDIIPVFGQSLTLDEIEARFDYLFNLTNPLYQPRLQLRPYKDSDIGQITEHLFEQHDPNKPVHFKVMPFLQSHGAVPSLGFRFGDFAYSTDVSEFTPEVLQSLKGIQTWLVDCGQYGQDFIEVHPNFEKLMSWNDVVQAPRVILTHLPVKVDYQTVQAELPEGYELAYDGMKIDFTSY